MTTRAALDEPQGGSLPALRLCVLVSYDNRRQADAREPRDGDLDHGAAIRRGEKRSSVHGDSSLASVVVDRSLTLARELIAREEPDMVSLQGGW